MEITADYAKQLTNTVNEINENANKCEYPWAPIMFAIKRGYNKAIMTVSCQTDMNFVKKMIQLGYKVEIEKKRFYDEAIIEW